MRHPYYKLEGRTPVPCALFVEGWRGDRRVAEAHVGFCYVSTVFLVVNHSFDDGPPLIFETMVFPRGTSEDLWCTRCSTWEQAERQHRIAIWLTIFNLRWQWKGLRSLHLKE